MVPTPKLSHLTREDLRLVYEPAEDTFILLDALEEAFPPESSQEPASSSMSQPQLDQVDSYKHQDQNFSQTEERRQKRPRLCVEIGSGSGCVLTFLAQLLGSTSAAFICTDINPHAALCSSRTGAANSVHLEPINGSLLSPIFSRIKGQVDVLVFNPPYVPTEAEEEAQAQLEAKNQELRLRRNNAESLNEREEVEAGGLSTAAAWAGGETGTRLLKDLIEFGGQDVNMSVKAEANGLNRSGIESILSPGGSLFLVAIKQNDPASIIKLLEAQGLESKIVLSRRAGREHLFVVRATKSLQSL